MLKPLSDAAPALKKITTYREKTLLGMVPQERHFSHDSLRIIGCCYSQHERCCPLVSDNNVGSCSLIPFHRLPKCLIARRHGICLCIIDTAHDQDSIPTLRRT